MTTPATSTVFTLGAIICGVFGVYYARSNDFQTGLLCLIGACLIALIARIFQASEHHKQQGNKPL